MSEIIVSRLEKYNEEDAAQLGKLMKYLSGRFSGEPIDKELLSAIIESPYHDQLVAKIEQRIVGAATLSVVMGVAAGRIGYLEDFVTDGELQGQGIGGKVWNEIINWCRDNNVDLEFTSNQKRQSAHKFYASKGAKIRDTTVFHLDIE